MRLHQFVVALTVAVAIASNSWAQDRLSAACLCYEPGDELWAYFPSRPSFNQSAVDDYRSGYYIIMSAPRCRMVDACKKNNGKVVEGRYIFRDMWYGENHWGNVPFALGSPNWDRY